MTKHIRIEEEILLKIVGNLMSTLKPISSKMKDIIVKKQCETILNDLLHKNVRIVESHYRLCSPANCEEERYFEIVKQYDKQ